MAKVNRFAILATSLLLLTCVQSEVLAAAPSPQKAPNSFASTPQDEIVKVLAYPGVQPVRILRTKVIGRYAVVLIAGSPRSDMPTSRALLLKRFSFGWQLLELVDEKCASPVNCALSSADVGRRTDVEAVRRLMDMDLPLILFVKVSGNYAYGREMNVGDDGEDGCAIFHRESGAWNVLVRCRLELDWLGMPSLNALAVRCGLRATHFARHFMDFAAKAAGHDNVTCPYDMAVLAKGVAIGVSAGFAGVPATVCRFIYNQMLHQEHRETIPSAITRPIAIANKTCELIGVRHDVAIVGLTGSDAYAVALLSKDWANRDAAMRRLRHIAAEVDRAARLGTQG